MALFVLIMYNFFIYQLESSFPYIIQLSNQFSLANNNRTLITKSKKTMKIIKKNNCNKKISD